MTGHNELKCEVHPFGSLTGLRFVVICSFYKGQYYLSYHSTHQSWETQGGHIEAEESPEMAARRELYEESGVKNAELIPVCDYQAYDSEGSANGRVYAAIIHQLSELPESEMSKAQAFSELPANLTYPYVTPVLFQEAQKVITSRSNQPKDDALKEIQAFLNKQGQIKAMPSKKKKKLMIFLYLAEKIESSKRYTEKDMNELIDTWTEFKDHATLRRELYDHLLLHRTEDGKEYWREKDLPSLDSFINRYI